MASAVAWLSFDAEQHRRTQLMLAALSGQGTVDELGLGVIRDLIARQLHPGLTVLHRRAKYLLFVPREYRALSGSTVEEMLRQGRRAEVRTMQRLVAFYRGEPDDGDDWGIIGRRRGELTQQLPSGMYWNLLRQLDILKEAGSMTDYCRNRVDAARQSAARSLLHEEGEVVLAEHSPWAELPPEESFEGFRLSQEEAVWLRERFLLTDKRPPEERSLVSWLLDPKRTTWWTGVEHAWEHPERDAFPSATAHVMYLGRDLDTFVHSARILYNYLCAQGRPDHGPTRDELIAKYETAMRAWYEDAGPSAISRERFAELNTWAERALTRARAPHAARARWRLTHQFLLQWWQVASRSPNLLTDTEAARVLKRRESWLKQTRARLGNAELLRGWTGDSGYFHLDYNWSIAMFICRDIHEGLGTVFKQSPEAA